MLAKKEELDPMAGDVYSDNNGNLRVLLVEGEYVVCRRIPDKYRLADPPFVSTMWELKDHIKNVGAIKVN